MHKHTNFQPDWVSPPGETIEERLEELGWTKRDFALRMELSPKHVNELLQGRVPISASVAQKLALVLGSTPSFWLTRDARYQAATEHQRMIKAATKDAPWLRELPLSSMRKFGWVKTYTNKGKQVLECLHFFGVSSVSAWQEKYQNPLIAFRASNRLSKKPGAVAAWIRQGELETLPIECEPFDITTFRQSLKDLRSLTTEPNPEIFVPVLREACAKSGVAVAFVRAPKGCPASGATKWLTPTKAMLLLSLRYKSNDRLWFSFFHEAAHLVKHGKRMLFIEGVEGLDTKREQEADLFAENMLISQADAVELPNIANSKKSVCEYAKRLGVAPGIVVGRLQKEKLLPWSRFNDLKVGYDWSL